MFFFRAFFSRKGQKKCTAEKIRGTFKVLKILNKIRVNRSRFPLRQEEDNLSVRVKAERKIQKAGGLTPRSSRR